MLESPRPKRNYIRRKKSLNDSTALIKSTLCFISMSQGTGMSPFALNRVARHHANTIEAACWDPHLSDITDDSYRRLVLTKTNQLCAALLGRHMPHPPAPQATGPFFPMPILAMPAAGTGRAWPDIELSLPGDPPLVFEPFECPRFPLDRDDIFMEAFPFPEALPKVGHSQ
jgi:hypothetical protein